MWVNELKKKKGLPINAFTICELFGNGFSNIDKNTKNIQEMSDE